MNTDKWILKYGTISPPMHLTPWLQNANCAAVRLFYVTRNAPAITGKSMTELSSNMVKMVVDMIECQRKSYSSAISAAAKFSGILPVTIGSHLKIFMKKRDWHTRLVKDAAVMGMIRSGLSNKEIAVRMDVHPNTVSNIKAKVLNS